MKNRGFVLRIIATILLAFHIVLAYAESTPKFTIVPTTWTIFTIPANGVRIVKYVVTNRTNRLRVLTMSPIVGVSQLPNYPTANDEKPACGYPFALHPGQACTLVLQIIGSATQGGVHSDVVVCKTLGVGDNRPDPFLCSQTLPAQKLDVTLVAAAPVTITTTPVNNLLFSVVVGGTVAVTNTSTDATAESVIGLTPTNPGFTVFSNCPASLFPLQSCYIYYNSNVAGTAQSIIQGLNTNMIIMDMEAVKPTISVLPSSVSFFVGDGATLTVTNDSTDAYAQNVGAVITSGSPNFYVSANNCGFLLAPKSACIITINAIGPGTGSVAIQGANTDPQPPQSVSLTASLIKILSSPSSLAFAVSPGSGAVTVTNTSPADALNVTGHPPPGSPVTATTCSSIPPGETCQITFSSPTPTTVTVPIYGSNTTFTSVDLSITVPTIALTPSSLQFVNGNTANVTVSVPPTSVPVTGGVNAYPQPPLSVSANTCTATLNPGTSCVMTFTSPANQATTVQSVPVYGSNTNKVGVNITSAPAALTLNPATIKPGLLSVGSTEVMNISTGGSALGVTANIPSGAGIKAVNSCPIIAPSTGCIMSFDYKEHSSVTNTVLIPIQGTNTTTANLYVAPIIISVSPETINIGQSNPGTVTVTQVSPSTVLNNFNGMAITIPPGSAITVGPNNNCAGGISGLNSTCTINFTGGPLVESQVITLQGMVNGVPGTNPVTFTANSLGSGTAIIDFSGSSSGIIDLDLSPAGGSVSFEVKNVSTSVPTPKTSAITATLPASWTGVTATYSSSCTSGLTVGGTNCTITLSSLTPNLPGVVVIEGSNDDTNQLEATVAFQTGGGLLYNLGNLSVVDLSDPPDNVLAWGDYLVTNAVSTTDGAINQALILSADPSAPASSFCANYNGSGQTGWYLPASLELSQIYNTLFLQGFGNFAPTNYWSSTENDIGTAWYQSFVVGAGALNTDFKNITYNVRCVRQAA